MYKKVGSHPRIEEIIPSECGYGLVHMFQAKHVLFFPIVIPYMFDAFGIVPESSSIPSSFPQETFNVFYEQGVDHAVPKLANFIQDTDGFIYVSFGSAVIASGMPKSMRDTFFEAFEAFPNLKFFWRWTGTVPENTPKNVLLHDWFPQQDILAHPKIKDSLHKAVAKYARSSLPRGTNDNDSNHG
ncbi:Ecdysteroid UDP-glucosyltransferase, partial [Orchesella cincta]